MKPDLIVIHEVIPENIFCFVIKSDDPNYDKWEKSHGLVINSSNEEDYDEEIREFICSFDFVEQKFPIFSSSDPSQPKELNGKYKIIFTGYLL